MRSPDEIRRNADQTLDEVVVDHPDFFHLEQMDTRLWWMGITKSGGSLHIWIRADQQGHLVVEVTEDGIGCQIVSSGKEHGHGQGN